MDPGVELITAGDGSRWTIPATAEVITGDRIATLETGELVITPGAIGTSLGRVAMRDPMVFAALTDGGDVAGRQRIIERMRNSLGVLDAPPSLSTIDAAAEYLSQGQQRFESVRAVLLAASVFVLIVAALSVLVLAVDQVRERRRALASMSAGGVGFGALAWSLLWQNIIPFAIGTVLALPGGTYLTRWITNDPLHFDWTVLAGMTGVAAALVLLVTLLSLPALRAATSVRNLRTE